MQTARSSEGTGKDGVVFLHDSQYEGPVVGAAQTDWPHGWHEEDEADSAGGLFGTSP